MVVLGLLIIALGAFCQSSSYVPINKIRSWCWESYWLVQGVFAWLVFPIVGALLSVPDGQSFADLFSIFAQSPRNTLLTIFFGVLWGVGGLTFGLSMRYLGVAMGQSIALGTCAALGTLLTPLFTGNTGDITMPVVVGVVVTLVGIAIIGLAGVQKSASLSDEEKRVAVKDFNLTKGLLVALLAGFMSACFSIGLGYGKSLVLPGTSNLFESLPATMLVTFGGFLTNAVYCLYQNKRNRSFGDYKDFSLWRCNILYCLLAGLLWYSQFFGLSLGVGFFDKGSALVTFSWCILMALNVSFSNVWGIILKEWKGCKPQTIALLVLGIVVLIVSCFLPQLIK